MRELVRSELAQSRFSGKRDAEPVVRIARERLIRKIGPFRAFDAPQEHDPVAPLAERSCPRQSLDPEPRDGLGQQACALLVGHDFKGLLGKQDRAERAQLPRAQALIA